MALNISSAAKGHLSQAPFSLNNDCEAEAWLLTLNLTGADAQRTFCAPPSTASRWGQSPHLPPVFRVSGIISVVDKQGPTRGLLEPRAQDYEMLTWWVFYVACIFLWSQLTTPLNKHALCRDLCFFFRSYFWVCLHGHLFFNSSLLLTEGSLARRQNNLDKLRVSTFSRCSQISFLCIYCFPFLPWSWRPVADLGSVP